MFSDRCRTTNNMLGDCYAAAVVQSLSNHELEMMDKTENMKKKVKDTTLEETEALMSPVTDDVQTISSGEEVETISSGEEVVTVEITTESEEEEKMNNPVDVV